MFAQPTRLEMVCRTAFRTTRILCLVAVLGMAFSTTGCKWFRKGGKEQKDTLKNLSDYTPSNEKEKEKLPPPTNPPTEGPRVGATEPIPESDMHKVYFDFDRADLRSDQLDNIDHDLKFLKEHKNYKVLIQGHCDERGTTEYNFSLGERRASAIKDYFVKNGIEAERLATLSKGEEEPADPGHDEAAWSKNRRCEFQRIH